ETAAAWRRLANRPGGGGRPVLRPQPRRGAPRYQAGEHPVRGGAYGSDGFRNRAGDHGGGWGEVDRDGDRGGDASVHEPRAGGGECPSGRAERHLQSRVRAVRDVGGRAALYGAERG